MPVAPLPPEALRRRCDPNDLPFATTEELPDLDELPGQERAFDAVRFGIGIRRPGYNLFALGGPGAGKHAMVGEFVQRVAAGAPTPPDLCYVYNFEVPQRPVALQLPPGMAAKLRADMVELVDDLKNAVPGLFESEDYRARRQVIEEEFKQRQAAALEALQERGTPKNLALIRTATGFAFAPVRDGAVISPEQFLQLPDAEQEQTRADIEALQQALAETAGQLPLWERERRQKVRDLNRQVTVFAVGHVIDLLREKYGAQAAVVLYLGAVEHDVVEHVDAFLGSSERLGQAAEGPPPTRAQDADRFRRYQVNVLVDNGGKKGAPVIYEDNPTQANLVGVVGQIAEMGAVIADFTLIKAGALHRANGGYLVLDAHRVLQHQYAWEALK
ncbi:MAG: AAA family ATPase, partial [Dongiaceae bacterium]